MELALSIVQVILCIFIIAVVLMQQGASQGMGAISGDSETHFGKSGATGIQGVLSKATGVAAILFGIVVIALHAIG